MSPQQERENRHPSREELVEDWTRSKRSEPMTWASHVASCDECRATFSGFDRIREALIPQENRADSTHISPLHQAMMAEGKLKGSELREAVEHLGDWLKKSFLNPL